MVEDTCSHCACFWNDDEPCLGTVDRSCCACGAWPEDVISPLDFVLAAAALGVGPDEALTLDEWDKRIAAYRAKTGDPLE
jgi:hypothetical protein